MASGVHADRLTTGIRTNEVGMDRSEAARLLGVSTGASARQVESAFRKRVRVSRFSAGESVRP